MNIETTTVDERLARAANTSDLSVTPQRQGDALMLIAAAKTPRVVGRLLISLHGEWDGCSKPRKLAEQEIAEIRRSLPVRRPPLVLAPTHLDVWYECEPKRRQKRASEIAAGWYEQERMRAVSRLKSLDRVKRGLLEILAAKKIESAESKVLGVLAWWLDSTCTKCNGTGQMAVSGGGRQASRTCPPRERGGCGGTGERGLPHGLDGRLIEVAINESLSRARQQINAFRHSLRDSLR